MEPTKFFETFAPACQAAMRKNGGFASVRLAQIALESNWGEATPHDIDDGRPSYNYTGVKGVGPAGFVRSWTWEVVDGEDVRVIAKFRAYHSLEEHVIERDRIFDEWRENYGAYLDAKTPEEAIHALVSAPCAYATDPLYSDKLISILEEYNLMRFDLPFVDVPADAWYADDVIFLRDAGVICGTTEGRFEPERALTRAESARLLRLVIRYLTGK